MILLLFNIFHIKSVLISTIFYRHFLAAILHYPTLLYWLFGFDPIVANDLVRNSTWLVQHFGRCRIYLSRGHCISFCNNINNSRCLYA